ncbi:Cold shock domain-containing protein 3 [Heracleum sosnowskyi]|uniref:Cold shock domain-containing protein 3 n=1 Tax=Heracleum sosnowskyi TaxID=360622 RepID=A0AAD8HAG4_9APIA|nr:Cold shock domain-containing protein 3 [Heracleum sosnowskyi]
MAQEYPKFQGVVLRFNNQKGYGFIKPDNEADDLFVHHSDINSEGFRTLRKNQSVEFFIQIDKQENKAKAIDVTVIKGSPIKNVRNGGGRGGVRGKAIECYNCGKYGHFGRDCYAMDGCYNCGYNDHLARDCTNASYCLNCDGEFGHTTRDCKKTRSRRNGGCYNCGGVGHFARDCPSATYGGKGGSNGGGGGAKREGVKCFSCEKEGHFAKNCPDLKK